MKIKSFITPKQTLSLESLLKGESITVAAKYAGVSRKTLHTWLKQPEFFTTYNALRQESLDAVITGIQNTSSAALETLKDLLKSKNQTIRFNSAIKILEMSGFTKDNLEMFAWGIGAQNIEELEQTTHGKKLQDILKESGY